MESIQEETHGLTISHIHHHRSSYEDLEQSNRPISSLITLKSTKANRLLKLDLNKEKIKIYSFTSLIESSCPPHKKAANVAVVPVRFTEISGKNLTENMGNSKCRVSCCAYYAICQAKFIKEKM